MRSGCRALEAFLADVYGAGRGVRRRGRAAQRRHDQRRTSTAQAHGLEPPNGVRVHVVGHRPGPRRGGRVPGAGGQPALAVGRQLRHQNRAAMSQVLPELFADHRIQPVDDYPRRLLAALRAAAPAGVADPTVVVLTPGVYNSAYFEHALLARLDGRRARRGPRPRLRAATRSACGRRTASSASTSSTGASTTSSSTRCTSGPTRCSAAPACSTPPAPGSVTIANAVGNGVADDKLLYTYVPDLIRYYLGEEPVLANVDTYRLEDAGRPRVGAGPPRPAGAQAGRRLRRQGHRHRAARRRADAGGRSRVKVRADPRGWIAQQPIAPVDLPDAGRRPDRAAARRPAAVRRQRRRGGLGAARRADPRRAARRASWSSTPARAAAPRTPGCSPPRQARRRRASSPTSRRRRADARRPRRRAGRSHPARASPQLQRPVLATSAAGAEPTRSAVGPRHAEPDRGVAVLDRPLRRARRRHRPHPRRAHPAAARGPVDRRAPRPADPCSASWASPAARGRQRPTPSGCSPRSPSTAPARARSSARCTPPARTPAAPARCCRPRSGRRSTPPATRLPQQRRGRGTATARTLFQLRARARGDGLRARRRHDEPRRELAVPHPRAASWSAPT